nr:putative ribonuclease H-like domain-containing protein [Tanacetum cinerariifolium]
MAPLTFADTHNMIAFLTKSDASEGFDQIVDFLNARTLQYALMVNPPIYVLCIKQFWDSVTVKKTNDVVKLQALIDRKKVVITEDTIQQGLRLNNAEGVECLPNEEIFAEFARMGYEKPPPNMVRNVDSPSKFLMYLRFLQVMINAQIDYLSSYNTKYTSPALTQKVFANIRRIGKGFLGVETPLFDTMLVQPHVQDVAEVEEDEDDNEVPVAPSPPSRTHKPSPPSQEHVPSPPQGRMEKDVNAVKEVNVAEPTVFDNEEVTMIMAQTLIKIKAEKARLFDEQMAKSMVRNVDSPSKFLMYLRFLQVMINAQIDYLSSYNTKYTSPALTQKVFANIRRIGKGFLGVETPLFDTMLVQPHVQDVAEVEEDEDDNEVPVAPSPPSRIKENLDADPQNTADDVADAAFNFKVNENDFHVSANRSNNTNRVNAVNARVNATEANSTNSTNSFNIASPSINAVSPNFRIARKSSFMDPSKYPDDPDMHELEDIIYSDDEKDGHTQEEGIDYDEVFAPVARIEAIQLFLAYASFMGFMVYQMNVKSAFLYGTIKEEVYVFQPIRFKDPDYPDKVYKVVKALYGLHQALRACYETLANYLLENGFQRGKIDYTLFIKKQKGDIYQVQVYVDDIIFGSTSKKLCKAFERLMKDKFQMSSIGELTFFLGLQVKQKDDGIFISQDKYVAKILRKFGFTDVKSASTPIETKKPLLKDLDGEDVDVHIYRSMIGSLMYLTSSRPDIMFAVCACARFQVTPKVSHLHIVKRIFRYLKGKPYLGLWYPRDSPFNLVAYSDSDYASASLNKKSTTGGCQFLSCRLISWQCKKHTVVATSSTEAEYVAVAS